MPHDISYQPQNIHRLSIDYPYINHILTTNQYISYPTGRKSPGQTDQKFSAGGRLQSAGPAPPGCADPDLGEAQGALSVPWCGACVAALGHDEAMESVGFSGFHWGTVDLPDGIHEQVDWMVEIRAVEQVVEIPLF